MNMHKTIVTHKAGGSTFSNGFIFAGSYDRSVLFFNKLAKEARKDFPKLKRSDIGVFIVLDSTCHKGWSGVRFPLPANTKKEGYQNSEGPIADRITS